MTCAERALQLMDRIDTAEATIGEQAAQLDELTDLVASLRTQLNDVQDRERDAFDRGYSLGYSIASQNYGG